MNTCISSNNNFRIKKNIGCVNNTKHIFSKLNELCEEVENIRQTLGVELGENYINEYVENPSTSFSLDYDRVNVILLLNFLKNRIIQLENYITVPQTQSSDIDEEPTLLNDDTTISGNLCIEGKLIVKG